MSENSKKAIIGTILAILLALALILIIKLPNKMPNVDENLRHFEFTNATSSNSKRESIKETTIANKEDKDKKATKPSDKNSNTAKINETKANMSTNIPGVFVPGSTNSVDSNKNIAGNPIPGLNILGNLGNTPIGTVIKKFDNIIFDAINSKKTIFETESIPYQVVYKTNNDLSPGEWRVITYGVNGEKVNYYEVMINNGIEESKILKYSQITKEPVDEIVEIGPEGSETSVDTKPSPIYTSEEPIIEPTSTTTEPVNTDTTEPEPDTTVETLPDTSPITETTVTSPVTSN